MLTACGLTTPRDVGNANRINLDATLQASGRGKHGSVEVQLPDTVAALDTYRIAATLADGKDSFIDGARWNDFLATVVQSSLRDNLSQSGRFTHVNDDTDPVETRYQLLSEIRSFNAVYDVQGQAPTIKVVIAFTLKHSNSTEVVKQFTLQDSEPASANSITAIHDAFDVAFTKVSQQTVDTLTGAMKSPETIELMKRETKKD